MAEIQKISEIIEEISPFYKKRKSAKVDKVPAQKFEIQYDSSSETLEPIYFWILDKSNEFFKKVDKLVDNFASSPGGGHFAEMGARATRMQEEGMKVMQTIGVLIKSLVNLIYDLKDFETRLSLYRLLNSKNKQESESAFLSLKQVWLDNVDIKRGNTSIKAMTFSQAAFVTLIDAFMAAKSEKSVDSLELNERVKRLLKPRLLEFSSWLKLSERELTKRYEIEKSWLKSQVNSLQLYTQWAKPYLRAAQDLSMQNSKSASLVKAFNTIVIELTLFGSSEVDLKQAVYDKDLPQSLINYNKRKYYSCVVIDFNFRGIPQKAGQHYVFGGKVNVIFKAYCLNEDEIILLKEKLKESDLETSLSFIEGATTESLNQLKEDIEYFLKPLEERQEEAKEKSKGEDVNPFMELFGFLKPSKKKKESKKSTKEDKKLALLKEKGVKKDDYLEGVIRTLGEKGAGNSCFKLFDIYKKSHGMASVPFLDD